jgi:hypothetical protein
MDGWMDIFFVLIGWMDGRMDIFVRSGWMDGWMDV